MNKPQTIFTKALLLTLLWISIQAQAAADPKTCAERRQFTFSWPFRESCDMQPRGGTSKGVPVTLDPTPHPGWKSLQEKGITDFERDRRAILAMAGPYRTSFDFLETVGYTPGFEPDNPYQSWGTEYVYVVEDRGDFISLQHIMVMYFEQSAEAEEGEDKKEKSPAGPMVMKHWRQDWQYEKREILTYQGHQTWARKKLPRAAVKGTWAQAVYQVDDSPRYEAYGKWQHKKNFSTWLSSDTWRPLPRREFSVRNDYQVLEGTNRHTIVPTGWVQEEENYKLALDNNHQPVAETPYLAKELGVNRYERIVGHDFSAGDRYWQKTGAFWADVRSVWADIIRKNKQFSLRKKVDGQSLFMPLFQRAEAIAENGHYDSDEGKAFIRKMMEAFLH